MWRKYNDGYVTEVLNTDEIFNQEPGDRPSTPYFLVYIKDEAKGALVDSVCRESVEAPPQEEDTVMDDYNQIVELPATEDNIYRPVSSEQDYGITESYQNESWNKEHSRWDSSSTRETPITGW